MQERKEKKKKQIFSLDENSWDLLSQQLSHIWFSSVSYSHHAAPYIPGTYLSVLFLTTTAGGLGQALELGWHSVRGEGGTAGRRHLLQARGLQRTADELRGAGRERAGRGRVETGANADARAGPPGARRERVCGDAERTWRGRRLPACGPAA